MHGFVTPNRCGVLNWLTFEVTESHADIRPVNRAASNLNAQIVNGSIQRVGSRERCIPVVVFDRATVESVNPTQKRYYSGTRVEASSPPTPTWRRCYTDGQQEGWNKNKSGGEWRQTQSTVMRLCMRIPRMRAMIRHWAECEMWIDMMAVWKESNTADLFVAKAIAWPMRHPKGG